MENPKMRFSKRMPAGNNRTYFVDVRESEKNKLAYLILGESRLTEGVWKSTRLVLFPDHVEAWKHTLEEALAYL